LSKIDTFKIMQGALAVLVGFRS